MAIQKISWIIFAWIFIGILLFGCVEKEKLAENLTGVKRPVIPEEKPLEKTTFRSGETVKACNTSVTVNAIKAKSYSFWTENQTGGYSIVAPPDKVFILVNVTVKNLGQDSVYISKEDFSLKDSEGNRSPGYIGVRANEKFGEKTIYKGEAASGIIGFEIPEKAKGLKVSLLFMGICGLFGPVTSTEWVIPDDLPIENPIEESEVKIEITKIKTANYELPSYTSFNVVIKVENIGEIPLEFVKLEFMEYNVTILKNENMIFSKSEIPSDIFSLMMGESETDYLYFTVRPALEKGTYLFKISTILKENKEEIGNATKTFSIVE